MDVYKAKIQSDRSLDKLKYRIVVRGDLQIKEMVGDNWSTTATMRTLLSWILGIQIFLRNLQSTLEEP